MVIAPASSVPVTDNSVEQPVVMFVTTAAIVSLVQAGAPQTPVNQLSIVGMIDWEVFPVAIETRARGFKHDAASVLRAIEDKAEVQALESLLN